MAFTYLFSFSFFHPRAVTEIERPSSALLHIAEKVTVSGVYLQALWAEQQLHSFQPSKISLPPSAVLK